MGTKGGWGRPEHGKTSDPEEVQTTFDETFPNHKPREPYVPPPDNEKVEK